MADTIIDGTGEELPGRRILSGTDLEIAYNLLGDDLVLRVNKAGVQVFGVVLQSAAKAMTAKQLVHETILACKLQGSLICSPSRGRAAHRYFATCRLPSNSMSNGSPIASPTCAHTAWNGSSHMRRRWTVGWSRSTRLRTPPCCLKRTIPGTSAPMYLANRASSCRTRAAWQTTGRSAPTLPPRVTLASH